LINFFPVLFLYEEMKFWTKEKWKSMKNETFMARIFFFFLKKKFHSINVEGGLLQFVKLNLPGNIANHILNSFLRFDISKKNCISFWSKKAKNEINNPVYSTKNFILIISWTNWLR
jgi:hypothetical protein